jgi:excisionase family DNA binding protein
MFQMLQMREERGSVLMPGPVKGMWPLLTQWTLNEQQVAEIRRLVREEQKDAVRAHIRQILEPMVESLLLTVSQDPVAAAKGLRFEVELKAIPAGDKTSYTTAEIAERFRVSQQQVRRWCEQGKLDAERTPGGTWRILPPRTVRPLQGPTHQRKSVRSVSGKWTDRAAAMESLREHVRESRVTE